ALMTNSSLDATGSLFTRLNAVGKDMGMTQQQALNLTKTVTQAIQIGGGSAQASEAAVQQFIQAMQGGVLRGEEFNSIMENGFGVAEALARGLGVTTGELRKMAEAGELSAERVAKALQSQAGEVQKTYDQFPTTITNALQKIATSWQILIGEMDQSNDASATVADWLVIIADNMDVVETLLNDIGKGFIWIGDQFKKIDTATIIALKNALTSIYEAIKTLGETLGEAFVITLDVLNDVLSGLYDFNNGIDEAGSKTNGLTKVLQAFNVAIGFVSDGFKGIQIAANLFVGIIYDLAAAWVQLVSKFTWGDVKQQAIADMDAMATKAQEYYKKASDGALEFKSKGVQALDEIG
ncbi:MAG: tape measure protein, partial [Acinetobacter sp.]